MSVWIVVAAAGLVSAGLRVAFVAGNRIPVPRWFDRAAGLVGPAFTAAVVAVWGFAGTGAPTLGPESVAIVVATPVALRTRSLPWTLAVGIVTTAVLRALDL
jgi:branched-subunit amino acid transport protein